MAAMGQDGCHRGKMVLGQDGCHGGKMAVGQDGCRKDKMAAMGQDGCQGGKEVGARWLPQGQGGGGAGWPLWGKMAAKESRWR